MKRMDHRKKNVGKVLTGMLIGGVLGATVGWLTAPASGVEIRRRLAGDIKGVREKVKTAEGNVESRARELRTELNENADASKKTPARRRNVISTY